MWLAVLLYVRPVADRCDFRATLSKGLAAGYRVSVHCNRSSMDLPLLSFGGPKLLHALAHFSEERAWSYSTVQQPL